MASAVVNQRDSSVTMVNITCACTQYYQPTTRRRDIGTYGWRRGVVASVVRRMNEVTVHWARLVLGWVTVFGRVYHHDV